MISIKPVSEMKYHPTSEKIVDFLNAKTLNEERLFFRVVLAYYWGVMASSMRAVIKGYDRNDLPINIYALNLSPSGTGKGYSTSLIERELLAGFRERFLEITFPTVAEQNLFELAQKRAQRKSTASNQIDPEDELEKVRKEFESLGSLLFSFDSGTTPAVKQMRHKLLMGNAGAVNLQIDEIGANLVGQTEVLDTFLELYDLGLVKDKLIKSSAENVRHEKLVGSTPTNMLLFGTPTKLFDGDVTERRLYDMLEMGYARRCHFGFLLKAKKPEGITADDIMKQMFDANADTFITDLGKKLEKLADISNLRKAITIPREVLRNILQYRLDCEAKSKHLNEYQTIQKGELENRYFKCMKLAAAYAFVDGSPVLTQDHLENAIKLTEECGAAFEKLLTPERNYAKLAKYLADIKTDVTLADMDEDLPYFRGGKNQKDEMINLAIAYGYKNNIIVKRSYNDGIMFLSGESLKPTNLNEMTLSYSKDMTSGYVPKQVPFDQLHNLVNKPDLHWLTHHVMNGYRNEDNAIPGFNLLVIDVDGSCQLSTAKLLLKDYRALYYTTKRHTETENRFRILLPTNYELRLDAKDYKEFYNNVLEGLPFKADEAASHRSKKWLTHSGHYEYTDGQLFDVLPFIPKTSKNEDRKQTLTDQHQLDNLERWVLNNTGDGNRNKQLFNYAMVLVDAGFPLDRIRTQVKELNNKLPGKLDESEIDGSIMLTIAKKVK
ncbi:hypothetical protein ACUND2_22315 [Serratia sp. IR-2025]